ncbi:MAG: CfrBI family restriction endonuclease [Microscillaceae bacterium]|nr:CfrBI family restriction endonuclease [Microscillaceae bacterium]
MSKQKRLSKQIPEIGRKLAKFSGRELLQRVGKSVLNQVVTSILCGGNVRALTEGLTQRRVLISNASLFITYLKGMSLFKNFEEECSQIILNELSQGSLSGEEKIYLQWLIGLTSKNFQNVLRSNPEDLERHLEEMKDGLNEVQLAMQQAFGSLEASIQVGAESYIIRWPSILQIFYAIGTQTLAIRGSEKSMYGKLFEKLILGSLLTILGFKLIEPSQSDKAKMVFWLTQRENKRESDATILLKPGVGARFDIGFIGPGNSEISLDKVSRFEREMNYGRQLHYMSTIILVDKIGEQSRIAALADEINGTIIQMSMTYWVKEVAEILNQKMAFRHPLIKMKPDESLDFIREKMQSVDLNQFIQ